MSKANRQRMYDKLMAAGREADLDPALKAEFYVEPPAPKPKKRFGKVKK